MREQSAVLQSRVGGVVLDEELRDGGLDERRAARTADLVGTLHTVPELCDGDRRDRDVVIRDDDAGEVAASALIVDQDCGVEDQSSSHENSWSTRSPRRSAKS